MAVETKTAGAANNKVVRYLKDVRAELRKITWPSREDITKSTGAVLLCLLMFTVIFSVYDSAFGWLFKTILNYIK